MRRSQTSEGRRPREKTAAKRKAAATRKRPRQLENPGRGEKRFQAERRALGKIQVHFEFQQSVLRKVRMAAAANNLSYADYVRKTVGLPHQARQRPRISLSFSESDLAKLAERYGKPVSEPSALKRCVMEEINAQLGGQGKTSDRS